MKVDTNKAILPLSAQESLAIHLSVMATDAVAMEDTELLTTCGEIIELMTPYVDQSDVALFDQLRAYVDVCSTRLANLADTARLEQQEQLRKTLRESIDQAAVLAEE